MMAHDHPALHRPADGATIHVGGDHASHLLVPVVPAADAADRPVPD